MKRFDFKILRELALLSPIFFCGCHVQERDDGGQVGRPDGQQAGRVVGTFMTVQMDGGGLRRQRPGSGGWEPLQKGDWLQAGDRLETGAHATARVTLGDHQHLSLDPNTAFRLVSTQEIELQAGSIFVDGIAVSSNPPLRIATDLGTVTLRGATAGVQFQKKKLIASIISGDATLMNAQKEIYLVGGQEGVAEPRGLRITHISDPAGLVSGSEELRGALASAGRPEENKSPKVPSGLGTLFAKVPGTSTILPFEALSQDVTVRIQDQVAITRVEQVFRNPSNRVVEGTYKFPLPKGAKLTRYDMEIKGKMMQGEIVERKRGRGIMKTVIRQFVDMMRDPALVEWESGSTFKTRIFPIQAKEKKRIVLSYIETLSGAAGHYRYVLPVSPAGAKAEKLPVFRIEADVARTSGTPLVSTPLYAATISNDGQHAKVQFEARDFEPMVDFVIQVAGHAPTEASLATYSGRPNSPRSKQESELTRAGALPARFPHSSTPDPSAPDENYFRLNLAPAFSPQRVISGDSKGTDWIFLADTSQSRSPLDMEIESRLLRTIISALGPSDRIKVLAFDMKPRIMNPSYAPPSAALLDQTEAFFDSMVPAGATNLLGALREAARHIESDHTTRIIVLGDGAATLGENRPGKLGEIAAQLFNPTNTSVTTIGVGSSVDHLAFAEITRHTGGRQEHLSTGEDLLASAVEIIAGLRAPVLKEPRISFGGLKITDLTPQNLPNIGSGEEISVTGKYRGKGQLIATLSGMLAGKPWHRDYTFNVGEAKATNTFVPLLYASNKMDALTLAGDDHSVKEAIGLSKKYSIPNRYTSFIVLENKAMYREFNVQRTDDRFAWDGTSEIEYEGLEDDEAEIFESASDGLAESGIGTSGLRGPGYGGGSGGLGSAAPMRSKRSAAKPRAKSKAPASKREWVDDLGGPPLGGHYSRPPCRPTFRYHVSAWRTPHRPKDRDLQAIASAKSEVSADPLARNKRKNLIKRLLRFGMYSDALAEISTWREMDPSNPVVLRFAGDLMRLAGDLDGAMRVYSGVLDVKPEDKRTMEMLASYFESKDRMADAYPFRHSLHLRNPKDVRAAARFAISAQAMGNGNEAREAADTLVEKTRRGGLRLKPGVSLRNELKEAVFRIVRGEQPGLLHNLADRSEANRAKFRVELIWNGEVDLDLWSSNRRQRFLGGTVTDEKLISGRGSGESEILYTRNAKPGSYRFQVLCAEPGGCGEVSGSLTIKAPQFRRTIPFVLENGAGTDIATVRIERHRNHCGW